MGLTDEDKAFLIKIGQGQPEQVKPKTTKPNETTTEKVEE
jgi:hypothetical protein